MICSRTHTASGAPSDILNSFSVFFSLLNPPPKSLADAQRSTLKTVSIAFSQVPLRELLHSSAVYSSPRYP